MTPRTKKVIWLLVGIVVLGFVIERHQSVKEQERLEAEEYKKALEVSALPQGVEANWRNYIQQRFNEEIQREGNNLKIRENYIGGASSTSYVSINYPYAVDCNEMEMGIGVDFGAGNENTRSVALTGLFSSDFNNEPELGVPEHSVAAKNLEKTLCRDVSNIMQRITSRSAE